MSLVLGVLLRRIWMCCFVFCKYFCFCCISLIVVLNLFKVFLSDKLFDFKCVIMFFNFCNVVLKLGVGFLVIYFFFVNKVWIKFIVLCLFL